MTTHPRILGIIPARSGSVGVPGKHMRKLGKHPLIHYTIMSALQSTRLSKLMISTDSPGIAALACRYQGVDIPFLRPKHLAMSETPSILVIQHVLEYYQNAGEIYDYICLLQPTTPFRRPGLIDEAITELTLTNEESLVSVMLIPNQFNPFWSFQFIDNRISKTIPGELAPRRQALPACYCRDGQIYLASSKMIAKGKLIDDCTLGLLNDQGPHINIDTEADWTQAEQWIKTIDA